jgi:hypothetical protein
MAAFTVALSGPHGLGVHLEEELRHEVHSLPTMRDPSQLAALGAAIDEEFDHEVHLAVEHGVAGLERRRRVPGRRRGAA